MNALASFGIRSFLWLVLLALSGLVVYTYYKSSVFKSNFIFFVARQAQNNTQELVQRVEKYLESKTQQLVNYARNLEQQNSNYTATICSLKAHIKDFSDVVALTVIYLPDFTLKTGYKSFIVNAQETNKIKEQPVHTASDFTQADWYKTVLTNLTPAWSSRVVSEFSNMLVVHSTIPLFVFDTQTQTKKPYAILVADIPVTVFSQFLQEAKADSSYGFIIDRKGAFIAYPLQEYVRAQKTIFDYARQPGQEQWYTIAQEMIQRQKIVTEFTDTQTKQKFTVAYAPILSTDWSVATVYSQAFTQQQAMQDYRLSLHIWLAAAALCFWIILLAIVYLWGTTPASLWALVAFFSGICFGLMMHIWMAYAHQDIQIEERQERIVSQEQLERFLRLNQRTRSAPGDQPTLLIPTGLWIAGMIVTDTGDIMARGILWQRYSQQVLNYITPKVLISNAYEVTLTPAYTHTEKQEKIVAWRFNVVIKEQFSYGKYPLDQHTLLLKLVHPDFDRLIILTPDFASWPSGQIQAIDTKNMQLSDWSYIKSFFGYGFTHYAPDLGIKEFGGKTNFPQLYFNILLKRNYIYPLIAGMLPIAIVTIVFFALLLMVKLGDTFTRIISIISSVFFALVVAHQRLKAAAPVGVGVNYLEYFYFCMYALILLVTVDMLLYFLGTNIPFIHPNNRPAKLLYWPLISFVFLVITFIVFY